MPQKPKEAIGLDGYQINHTLHLEGFINLPSLSRPTGVI